MTVGPGIAPGLLVPAGRSRQAPAGSSLRSSEGAKEGITAGGEFHPALRTQAAGTSDGTVSMAPMEATNKCLNDLSLRLLGRGWGEGGTMSPAQRRLELAGRAGSPSPYRQARLFSVIAVAAVAELCVAVGP